MAQPDKVEAPSPFYISANTSAAVSHQPKVLKQGDGFAVLDQFGNIQALGAAAEGLFFEDTRYLAYLDLAIDGVKPLLLSSVVTEDNFTLSVDLSNPDLSRQEGVSLPKGTIHILSETVMCDASMVQTLDIHNYGAETAIFRLDLGFDADFADIFEVRGAVRAHRGKALADSRNSDGVSLAYRGIDDIVRRTRLEFEPAPEYAGARRVYWPLELPPGGAQRVRLAIHCQQVGDVIRHGTIGQALSDTAKRLTARRRSAADIYTSNESFNNWLNRSRADLDMLVTETPHGFYAYAGIPWFSTAFGRDGIVTALECLWFDPTLAAGTLRFLAAHQAETVDPKVDAEPGKILHETRKGEMAGLGEVPFGLYYGSVDSTPLFVMLAAAYYGRTGDLALIRSLWANIRAAIGWMEKYGGIDRRGFLEYDRKSLNGLINQGWKDSGDSVFHDDGRLAEAPIALVEVQAYAYAAYRGASTLAGALGDDDEARRLSRAAQRLQRLFEDRFWVEELGTYALALDGHDRPCRVRSSNAGHVLFGQLASPARAARVARTLMAESSYSRWGIRTLAETERRYNPISYHNGSVWPHDNGVIAMGFGRYGLRAELAQLLTGMFDAAQFMELQRLPELFCGFIRRPGSGPTSYPAACIPQAWSAASGFAMLGAILGISFDPPANRILFTHPTLPPWLDECRLFGLRVNAASVDLLLRRSHDDVALHVVRRDGPLDIVLTT